MGKQFSIEAVQNAPIYVINNLLTFQLQLTFNIILVLAYSIVVKHLYNLQSDSSPHTQPVTID